PGLSFDVVGSVPAGTEVGVRGFEVSDANNETWVRIRLEDDTIGYVNADRVVVSQFPTISEAFEETIETEEPDLAPIETTLEEEPTEAETEEAPAEADESTAVPSATPLPTDEALASAQGADGLADGEGLAVVSGDDAIEVRQGPGETFDVIATADSGTELPVRGLEGTDDGETWLRVRLEDGTIGYVNASAVTVETFPTLSEPFVVASDATPVPEVSPAGAISAASPTDGENAGSGTVTGDATVDVRLGPSADFDVIATAEPDTELLVRGLSAGESGETWVRVQLEDGTVGYINADNVNVTAFPAVDEPFDTAELVREGDALQPPAVTTAEPDDAAPSALATNVARVNPPTPTATPLVVAAAPPQGIVVDAGQVDTSLERQAFAVRLGLITSAVIIGLGGLINALTSRRKG
ncbi:MAG: SH3 domain-containing protein, partial [Chloroflexota bacterium]